MFAASVQRLLCNSMLDPCVDHCFGADGDFCISCKRLALFLLFDVDSKGLIDVHGLVEEGFVVVNHDFDDEGEAVKDMEDNCMEGALVVSFIMVPEFC